MKHQPREMALFASVTITTLAAVGFLMQNAYGPTPGTTDLVEYQRLVQGPGFVSVDKEEERPFLLDSRLRLVSSHLELHDLQRHVPLSKPGR